MTPDQIAEAQKLVVAAMSVFDTKKTQVVGR